MEMETANRKHQAMLELRAKLEHVRQEQREERNEFERLWDHRLDDLRAKWAQDLGRPVRPQSSQNKQPPRLSQTLPPIRNKAKVTEDEPAMDIPEEEEEDPPETEEF
jgi:hypothetical protein